MFSSLSLITAVAVTLQANPTRPVVKHAPRSGIARTPAALETMAAGLAQLDATAPVLAQADAVLAQADAALAGAGAQLEGLQGLAGLQGLEGLEGLQGLEGLEALDMLAPTGGIDGGFVLAGREFATEPRAPWASQDPGDSLYRAARAQLNRNRYTEAAKLFTDLINRYERSSYTPDAYYWAAFALYRTGEDPNLQQAVTLLDKQKSRYANAATRGDSDALLARVLSEQAKRGNSEATIRLRQLAHADSTQTTSNQGTSCGDDDDDPRIAALSALNQMDPETAVPILKRVLAKRDACSAGLRRKAVFVLSQKRTDETEDILLSVARNDPDSDVRQQAVFWLSQVGTEKALTALDSIARTSTDEDLLEKAIFAISQIHSPHAVQALRDFATRESAPEDAREKAVFWIGQSRDAGNGQFLRDLYGKVTNEDLKEKIIFAISQMHSAENTRWLMDLALNSHEDIDVRKKALFWAGQSGADLTDLVQLYDRTTDQDMKEQLIFVYSQRHEPAAIDKMIDIARHETNPELRKKAIFWLGQSHDPKAAQALLEIINQ